MDKIKLYPTTPTGTYARDEAGDVWATWRTTGWSTCALCGKTITHGWEKGKLGDEQTHYCDEHIEKEEN